MSKSAFALCVLAAAVSACEMQIGNAEEVTEEKRYPASADTQLTLRTFDGSIEVRSWDRDEVLVQIRRQAATAAEAQALEVRSTQEGNRILIEAPGGGGRNGVSFGGTSPAVGYVVRTPRKLRLEATTGDGSIEAMDVAGTIELRTGDGSIRLERVAGQVRARSGDGSIAVENGDGDLDVQSGDGSISMTGRFERLRVASGDGSVSITAADGSTMSDDWSVTTGDGSVAMTLPAKFDGRVDARGEGDSTFQRTYGKGGRVLQVRTGDGSISVDQREE
jgi:hypothetical protein